MKPWLGLVVASGLFAAGPLWAQEPAIEAAPAEHPAHKELRALRDEVVDALNKNDLDRLLRHLTADAVLTWQNAEVSRGHEGMRAYHDRMMVGPNRLVERTTAKAQVDEQARLYGPDKDTALAFGGLQQEFVLTSGMNFSLASRWTAHLVKEGDAWKISAFHVSANLFDNPVLHMAMKRTAYWTGGFFLFLGIVLGLLFDRIAMRRRQRRVAT